MSSAGSETGLIPQIQLGNSAAVRQLWDRYFHRLVGLAHKKLQRAPRLPEDSEVAALSAMASFVRRLQEGKFPELEGRDDVRVVLFTITQRKVISYIRREPRPKHGGGKIVSLDTPPSDEEQSRLEALLSGEPSPAAVAVANAECERLLDRLGDERLRHVAQWKLEGFSNKEIATKLGVVERTIKYKLASIRTIWKKELAS